MAACLSSLTAVESFPERKLLRTRTSMDTVQQRHTATDSNKNMCLAGHPPQNTVTCYNLYLTKNAGPGVSHLSIIVHCKDI